MDHTIDSIQQLPIQTNYRQMQYTLRQQLKKVFLVVLSSVDKGRPNWRKEALLVFQQATNILFESYDLYISQDSNQNILNMSIIEKKSEKAQVDSEYQLNVSQSQRSQKQNVANQEHLAKNQNLLKLDSIQQERSLFMNNQLNLLKSPSQAQYQTLLLQQQQQEKRCAAKGTSIDVFKKKTQQQVKQEKGFFSQSKEQQNVSFNLTIQKNDTLINLINIQEERPKQFDSSAKLNIGQEKPLENPLVSKIKKSFLSTEGINKFQQKLSKKASSD